MDINNTDVILASASPRRRQLLEQVGVRFQVRTSEAEEIIRGRDPYETVKLLSEDKAREVADKTAGSAGRPKLIIGADTVVVSHGRILGKPHSEEEAFRMIEDIQGSSHSVMTGVTIICGDKAVSFVEETKVNVYPMSHEEIAGYIACGESMDKAGAYGIQGNFAMYVQGIEGDYNNVVGLPVARLMHEIMKL